MARTSRCTGVSPAINIHPGCAWGLFKNKEGGKGTGLGFGSDRHTLAMGLRQVLVVSLNLDFLVDKMGTILCHSG